MGLNPNIVPQKQIGSLSNQGKLISNIHNFFYSHGFSEIKSQVISDTKTNLIWWLTPTYSPLYKYWQLDIQKSQINTVDEPVYENMKYIVDFLKQKFWDKAIYHNKQTLTSQFSGLLIKYLLSGWWDQCYVLDRLFRTNNKDYLQVESWTIGKNIHENIKIMQDFLENILGESVVLESINNNFFYFVSPSFQFIFTTNSGKKISLVGGYIDNNIIESSGSNSKICFIFGVKLEKLFINEKKKERQNEFSREKSIIVDSRYKLQIENQKEYLQFDTIEKGNEIRISPKKLTRMDIFSKKFFFEAIGITDIYSKEYWLTQYAITDTSLKLTWPRKSEYFECLEHYLRQYYWGEVIQSNDNCLEIHFTNFNIKCLEDIFMANGENNSSKEKNISISRQEIFEILWMDIDIMDIDIANKIKSLGYNNISLDNLEKTYTIWSDIHRFDIQTPYDFLGDIFHIISNTIIQKINSDENKSLGIDKKKDPTYKYINLADIYFSIKWYNQVILSSQRLEKKTVFSEPINNFFKILFGDTVLYNNNEKLYNNLSLPVIQSLISSGEKYPRKIFIKDFLTTVRGKEEHICIAHSLINTDLNMVNTIFSEVYSFLIQNNLYKDICLTTNDEIPFLQQWMSFDMIIDWEKKWYIGVINNAIEKRLKWFTIISEFTF